MQKYFFNLIFLSFLLSFSLKADFVIDVRTVDEYKMGHLEKSINIEWQKIASIEASIAKDKRKLVVKLASTLQDIENERRAKLTPKRRRNKSKGSSSMMSNSPTLPSISGSSNSVIIKSPKQSYSRIKVSKRG